MMTVEQLMTSHKSNIETLFGLTSKAFEGVEKIVEIELNAEEQKMFDHSVAAVKTLVEVVDKLGA